MERAQTSLSVENNSPDLRLSRLRTLRQTQLSSAVLAECSLTAFLLLVAFNLVIEHLKLVVEGLTSK